MGEELERSTSDSPPFKFYMNHINNNWWKVGFNDNFYKIYYHYLKQNYFSYIGKLIKFVNLKKNDFILDVACGNGAHLVTLKKLGFKNLKGFDYHYTESALKNTKEHCIEIYKHDMRRRIEKEHYDFIMLNSTSFGYFNDQDNEKVLKNCHEALNPGGKLFIDNLSREFIVKNFCPKHWANLKDGVFLLEEREWSKDKKNLLSLWHLIEKDKVSSLPNKLRLYSIKEFGDLFLKIGFKKIKIKKINEHNWFLAIK